MRQLRALMGHEDHGVRHVDNLGTAPCGDVAASRFWNSWQHPSSALEPQGSEVLDPRCTSSTWVADKELKVSFQNGDISGLGYFSFEFLCSNPGKSLVASAWVFEGLG